MNAIIETLRRGTAAVAGMRSTDFDDVPVDELVEITRLANQLCREAQNLAFAATSAGTRKDAHRAAGASSMDALIAQSAGISRTEASRQRRLAQHLDEAPVLREQMSRPGMSTQKAHVITDAMRTLPADLPETDRQTIEDALAVAAPDMSVEEFKRKAKRALEIVDRPRADHLENERLVAEEATQRRKVSFWMTRPDEDGMVKGGFEIDALTGDLLRSVIDSHTAPRKVAASEGSGALDRREESDYKHRAGTAFCALVRHLSADGYGNHGGMPATLMVTISEESLRGRTDTAGITEHGTPISAGQVRQLACASGILPAVMNGKSQILDLGREQRLHSPAQRRALAHRDGGCAFPGCDRPPGWTEAHHIRWWKRDHGETTLDNGVLLCSRHHHHVHEYDIPIKIHAGRAHFLLPHSDQWQTNTRYRPATA